MANTSFRTRDVLKYLMIAVYLATVFAVLSIHWIRVFAPIYKGDFWCGTVIFSVKACSHWKLKTGVMAAENAALLLQ